MNFSVTEDDVRRDERRRLKARLTSDDIACRARWREIAELYEELYAETGNPRSRRIAERARGIIARSAFDPGVLSSEPWLPEEREQCVAEQTSRHEAEFGTPSEQHLRVPKELYGFFQGLPTAPELRADQGLQRQLYRRVRQEMRALGIPEDPLHARGAGHRFDSMP